MKSAFLFSLISIFTITTVFAQGEQANVSAPAGTQYFGKKIDEKGAIKPAEFLKKIEGQTEMDTKLEAKIITCCKKKGCWMDVDLENGTTMKVRFKDYEFFVPKDADGRTTVIEGKAVLETVDVATLQHYAEDAGKSKEEIAAITEPEVAYSFEAAGVIIK